MHTAHSVTNVRARVGRLLALDRDVHVEAAGDGTFNFTCGSATYVVEVSDQNPITLRVYSVILRGIRLEPALYEAVNEINRCLQFARMFVSGDALIVATELIASALDLEELQQACHTVSTVADHYDDQLQGIFGGRMASEGMSAAPAFAGMA